MEFMLIKQNIFIFSIAKMFRESIRRSFRQIRDMTTPVHTPGNTVTSMADMELARGNADPQLSVTGTGQRHHLPPAYTSVILEMRSHVPDDLRLPANILSDRLSQLVDCESAEASTSSSSACSSTTDCTGNTSSSSSGSSSSTDTTNSAPMTAAELTRLLRESFRRSARNTIRNSLRFIRKAKPADNERPVTDDDDTTDTDQGGRHLVQGAVRIHRDPSLSNVVVTLPNANGDHSESIA